MGVELNFHLNAKKTADARKWEAKHKCPLRGKSGGAIGGKTSFVFVSTSIGYLEKIKCACGGELLLNGDEL